MTTSKPEVKRFNILTYQGAIQSKGAMCVLASDYDALQSECEKLRAELDQYRTSKPALLLFSRVPRYRISKGQAEDGWGRSTGYIRVSEDPAGEFMRTDDVRRLLIQPLLEQTK